MSDLNMNIVIGATVDKATQGLKTVSAELANTAIAAQKIDSSVSKTSSAFTSLGSVATRAFSGIGSVISDLLPDIAGMVSGFGAAVLVTTLVSKGMELLTSQTREADAEAKRFTDTFKSLETETNNLNKELGLMPTALDEAQTALDGVDEKLKEIRGTFKDLNTEPAFITFFKGGFEALAFRRQLLKEQNDLIKEQAQGLALLGEAQLAETAKQNIALNALADTQKEHDLQIAKERNDAIISDSKAAFSQRFASLKASLDEQFAINKLEQDKELQLAGQDFIKRKTLEENFRFANLQAQEDYNKALIHLQEQQAAASQKASEAAKRAAEAEQKRIDAMNARLHKLSTELSPIEVNVKFATPGKKATATNFGIVDPLKDLAKQIEDNLQVIQETTVRGVEAIGEGIGSAIAGAKNPFAPLLEVLAEGMKKLGENLIVFGGIQKLVKAALGPLGIVNPFLAIGAGIALEALAAVIEKGAHAFAGGGIVTRPTLALIGEQGPEEVRRLNSVSNTSNVMQGEVIFQISGQNLRGILKRADQTSSFIN